MSSTSELLAILDKTPSTTPTTPSAPRKKAAAPTAKKGSTPTKMKTAPAATRAPRAPRSAPAGRAPRTAAPRGQHNIPAIDEAVIVRALESANSRKMVSTVLDIAAALGRPFTRSDTRSATAPQSKLLWEVAFAYLDAYDGDNDRMYDLAEIMDSPDQELTDGEIARALNQLCRDNGFDF